MAANINDVSRHASHGFSDNRLIKLENKTELIELLLMLLFVARISTKLTVPIAGMNSDSRAVATAVAADAADGSSCGR